MVLRSRMAMYKTQRMNPVGSVCISSKFRSNNLAQSRWPALATYGSMRNFFVRSAYSFIGAAAAAEVELAPEEEEEEEEEPG